MTNRLLHRHFVLFLPWNDPGIRKRRIGKLWIEIGDGLVRIYDRFEGWCDLFPIEQIPVNRLEERVFFQFRSVVTGP